MKRTKIIQSLVTVALLLVGSAAFANPGLKLGQPDHAGPGCPVGSVSATLSPDANELSVLFDQYIVEAGGVSGKRFDRKSCNISVPVQIPQGYSVSIFQVDYRGFAGIPVGGRGSLSAEYFFTGGRGVVRTNKALPVGGTRDYIFTDRLEASAQVWTPCGASTNLRINTGLLVQTNRNYDDTLATVDSVDISNGLIYHIQWKRCR
jgi:hypothetical protein